MASWFIIAVATISVIGIMMFAGLNLIQVTSAETGRSEAIARLNQLPGLILANSWQGPDGVMYLPAPSPAGPGAIEGVTSLPAWLKRSGALANAGQVVYCPFAPSSGPPVVDLYNPDGSKYTITTATQNGRAYVTGGRPNYADAASNPNLMGFVMTADNTSETYKGCNTITKTGNTYSAPGMLVRPILIGQQGDLRAERSGQRVIYVSMTGSSSSKGDTRQAPTTLENALSRYRSNPWTSVRIELLTTGTYSLYQNSLSQTNPNWISHPAGSNITFVGPGRDTTIIGISANGVIDLPVNISLTGIALNSSNTTLINANTTLTANASRLGPLQIAQSGKLIAVNTDVTTDLMGGQNGITLQNGAAASFTGTTQLRLLAFSQQPIVISSGATFSLAGSTTTIASYINPLFQVQAGGRLTIADSTVSVSAMPLQLAANNSSMTITNSTLTFSAASNSRPIVMVGQDGNLAIVNSTIAIPLRTASQRSIVSRNASRVTGSGANIQGCWADNDNTPVFAQSPTPTNGTSSAVTADEALPALSATPTTAEITAYMAAMQRNSARAAARIRNTSQWTCVM